MLQLCKKLGPQVEHDLLPDVVQQVFLDIRKDESKQEYAKKGEGKDPYTIRFPRRDEIINRHFGEIRLRTDENISDQRQGQRSDNQLPVRPEIAEQTARDTKIICLTYLIFFVIFS